MYPEVNENSLGEDTPAFTFPDIEYMVLGEENVAVLALEKRLLALQYLSSEEADGVFDDETSLALKYLQATYGLEETSVLDDKTFDLVVELIKVWEEGFTVEVPLLDIVLSEM